MKNFLCLGLLIASCFSMNLFAHNSHHRHDHHRDRHHYDRYSCSVIKIDQWGYKVGHTYHGRGYSRSEACHQAFRDCNRYRYYGETCVEKGEMVSRSCTYVFYDRYSSHRREFRATERAYSSRLAKDLACDRARAACNDYDRRGAVGSCHKR